MFKEAKKRDFGQGMTLGTSLKMALKSLSKRKLYSLGEFRLWILFFFTMLFPRRVCEAEPGRTEQGGAGQSRAEQGRARLGGAGRGWRGKSLATAQQHCRLSQQSPSFKHIL